MNTMQIVFLIVVPVIIVGIYILMHHRSSEKLVKSECQKIMDVVNPRCEIRDNRMSPEEILRMVNLIWRAEKVNQPIKCMYNDKEINVYVDSLCHTAKEFSGGVFIFDVNTPQKLRAMDGQVFLDENEDIAFMSFGKDSEGEYGIAYSFKENSSGLYVRAFPFHFIPYQSFFASFFSKKEDSPTNKVYTKTEKTGMTPCLFCAKAQIISTITLKFSLVAQAFITERMAFAILPCLPITLPISSGATLSSR